MVAIGYQQVSSKSQSLSQILNQRPITASAGASATIASDALMNPFDGASIG